MTSFADRVARVFAVYVALIAMSVVATHSQNQRSQESAIVTGMIRDSENRPVENAIVSLQSDDDTHKFTFQSNSDGRYRFEAVPAGRYELRVSKSGYGLAKSSPFVLGNAESKSVTLRLLAETAKATGNDNSAAVNFSDEIHFNVAGVSDPSNLGGHGSDTVLRTKETLAKETASLNREAAIQPNNGSHPAEDVPNIHVRLA